MEDQEREELQFEIAMNLQKLNDLVKKLEEDEPMIVVFGDKESPRMLNPYKTFQVLPVWQPKRVKRKDLN